MSIGLGILLQVAVSVQVADTIAARTPAPLMIRATAPGNTAPTVSRPSVSGASLSLVSEVTRLGGGFGQAVATREVRYVLRAASAGTLSVSAVVASLGQERAVSVAQEVVVLPPPSKVVPAIVARAPVSRQKEFNFHAIVSPDTVWVGEQVTMEIGIFIDDELRARLQRNPEYVPSAVEGAVAFDLPVANDNLANRIVDGARYRPFVFARALFPLRAGTLAIPAARLGYTIGGRTMFGKAERQTATTAAMRVFVRELPTEGRPLSFSGAVGQYTMTASLDRSDSRVGDAVELTVRVDGVGNVKMLPAPTVQIAGVTASVSGESAVIDSADLVIRGSKLFKYQLTPTQQGTLDLGSVRYTYFDPVRGAYAQLESPLGALRVSPGSLVATESESQQTQSLPLQAWRENSAADVTDQWWYRALIPALGAPWMLLGGVRIARAMRSRRRLERRRTHRGTMYPMLDAAGVRRAFIAGVAPMIALRRDQPIAAAEMVQRLRRVGVTPSAADAAGAILSRLDQVTFGSSIPELAELLPTLRSESVAVQAQLQRELSPTARQRLWSAARGLPLVFLTAGALLAQQPAAFNVGVAAYRKGDFSAAAAAFASAAESAPLSTAAWTNLGAAHWMRADTAGAILAWQRSARLAPRGNRAVAWLDERSTVASIRARIAPISPNDAWLMLLALTVFISVCGAYMRFRRKRISNVLLLAALALIGVGAALSLVAQASQSAEGVVVIRREIALRSEPVLAGESTARAKAGELGIVRESRGTWRLLEVSTGRSGWVEADALQSIALADGRDVAAAESRIAREGAVP